MNISENKSANIVYQVKVEVHSTDDRYGLLIEKDPLCSDILFTHKQAHEKGVDYLRSSIHRLYETSDYCAHEEDSLTIEDFIKDRQVYYRFTVLEIDLKTLNTYDYRNSINRPKWCLANRPPHLEYSYDLDGNLIDCNYVYYNHRGGIDFTYPVSYIKCRPGDELPDAGTKFKEGDLVRLIRPCYSNGYRMQLDTEQVFVVCGEPKRDKNGALIENTYMIETVSDSGEYLWDFDFGYPFQCIHENELQLYDEELPEDNPLRFLQRIYLGEFEYDNIVSKMENGEISLRNTVSLHDIPELKSIMGKENKK